MSRRAALLAAAVLAAPALVALTPDQAGSLPIVAARTAPRPASTGSAGLARLPPCPPTQLTRTGSQTTPVDGAATDATWNLRGAVWDRVAPAPIAYPVRSDAWTRG